MYHNIPAMKKSVLISILVWINLLSFAQVNYTVYFDGQPINDYALIDLRYTSASPQITIINNYTQTSEYIRLLSSESNYPDYYFSQASGFPIDIPGGLGMNLSIVTPYSCNNPLYAALLTLNIINYKSNTSTFHIYVIPKIYMDNTAPVFSSCPANITVSALPGKNYAVVSYTMPVATDNCGDVRLILQSGLPPGARYPICTTTLIRYNAYDQRSNSSSCSFMVTVTDNESPVITCPSSDEKMVVSDESGAGVLPDYKTMICAYDNNQGSSLTLTQSPEPGTIISGTTAVTVQVKDFSNNVSECIFDVTLKDILPPVFEDPGDKTLEMGENCSAALTDYTPGIVVSDNQDASVDLFQYPLPGTVITAPVYVTITATDDAGNRSETGFTVEVTDNIIPEIVCPPDQVISVLDKELPYTVQCREFDPVIASDNCSFSLINDINGNATLEGEDFDPNSSGTISWTITDGKGNSNSCSFNYSFDVITAAKVTRENNVSVFPNPAKGLFTVYTPKNYMISIFDTKGVPVLTQAIKPGYNTVDLSTNKAGYYIITFTDDPERFSISVCKETN